MTSRAGRVHSIESAQAKAAGGKKGMASRWGGAESKPPEYDESFMGPFKSVEDYIKRLGPPQSWSDAKKMEEVAGEIIMNEQRQTANDLERRKLFTAEQVQAKAQAISSAMLIEVAKVERLCDGLDGMTPEMRMAFLDRFRAWRKGVGEVLVKACG